MIGWVGDELSLLQPHLFADADFAGCVETLRSTSDVHLAIRGLNTCFPISGQSKRQTCVSHSTPEAEIVAADFALRLDGLPCLDLWHMLLPHKPGLIVHEDNQAMMTVVIINDLLQKHSKDVNHCHYEHILICECYL